MTWVAVLALVSGAKKVWTFTSPSTYEVIVGAIVVSTVLHPCSGVGSGAGAEEGAVVAQPARLSSSGISNLRIGPT